MGAVERELRSAPTLAKSEPPLMRLYDWLARFYVAAAALMTVALAAVAVAHLAFDAGNYASESARRAAGFVVLGLACVTAAMAATGPAMIRAMRPVVARLVGG